MKAASLDVTKTVLENGLTLLCLENHHVPIVTSTIWYKVGSANEAPGQTGISHFLEHLMFKGTPTYGKGVIDFLTSAHGGHNNAGTIYDYTMYYFNFSSDRWEIALEIEADRMRHCLFDSAEFEAERKVVLEEFKQQQDSPWGPLGIRLEAALFPEHPYQHTPIGWQTDIEHVSLAAVIEYYQTYYVPNNAVIVLVGDLDTPAAIAKVQALFAPIPRGRALPPVQAQKSRQSKEQRLEIWQDSNLKRLQIGYHAATLADAENDVLDVIDYILSHGKTARLYQRLQEKERLVTFVDTYNHPRRLPGIFYIFAELRPGVSPERVETVLNEEIRRLQTEDVPAAELQKIKNVIEADFIFEKETTAGLAHALGEAETLHTYLDLETYFERIEQLTPAEIRRVAQKYLAADNRIVGWAFPKNHAKEEDAEVLEDAPAIPPLPEMVFHAPAGHHADSGAARQIFTSGTRSFQTHHWNFANGLTVLFLENHALPVVSIEAFVHAGEKFVPDEKAGLSVLTGRLLEEGTTSRSALEIAEAIESVGGNLQTKGQGASAQVLAKDLPLAIEIVADILRHPVFTQASLEKERQRLLAILVSDDDNPSLVAYNLFQEMVYGAHPHHRPQKGYQHTVQTLAQADILAYYAAYFVPNNTILAIVGDVTPAEVLAQVQRGFDEWPRRALPPPPSFAIPQPNGCVTRHLFKAKEQNHLYLGHPGITRANPDYYALLTLDHILGTGPGFTDRISKKLRDEEGLAYTVYANITGSAGVEPGAFMAYIGTSPANTARAIAGFLEELRKIRITPVAPEELELAQNYLTGSYVFHFETSTQLAQYLIHTERFQLGANFLWEYPQFIQRVTVADILRVAQQYLDPENYYVAIVGTLQA